MTPSRTAAVAVLSALALSIGLGMGPASAEEVAQAPVRINAGGPAGVFEGVPFVADRYAVGGWSSWSKDTVTGTSSSALYQARRVAPTAYVIPVLNGTYDVTVKTAETWFGSTGKRRFSVTAEGQTMTRDLDLFAVAGHDKAYAVTTRVVVADGRVDLGFTASVNKAVVAAIEVVPVPVSTATAPLPLVEPVPAPAPAPADTVAPVTSLVGGPGQGSVETSTSASFALASDEPGSFQCRLGDASFAPCAATLSLSGLPLGVQTLQVRAVDAVGNVDATPVSRTWTVVSGTPGASKPDAWNTGVPAGTTLKRYDGTLTVTTAGAVVDALDIYGDLVIKAPNVTVRRTIVRGTPTSTNLINAATSTATNLLVEDSELLPSSPTYSVNGVTGGNYTMRRVEITKTVDGFGIHIPNVRIESSWVHGLTWYSWSPYHSDGSHNDAIQVHGGNNIRILGNRLEGANNAAIMMTQDASRTYDVDIASNWMNNGGCTVNIADKGSTMADITATANRFGHDTRNYDCAIIRSSLVQLTATGNVWDDTGTAVRIRNG